MGDTFKLSQASLVCVFCLWDRLSCSLGFNDPDRLGVIVFYHVVSIFEIELFTIIGQEFPKYMFITYIMYTL